MLGVPHSLVIITSRLRCHQKSYAKYCEPRSLLPRADDVEGVAIHHEDAAGPVAVGVAERADVDCVGTAVHGVRARVPGTFAITSSGSITRTMRGCDGSGFRIDDVDARRAQTRHDEIAPLDVRMRRERTERRAARVPAEMMQLVASVRQFDARRSPARNAATRDRCPRPRAGRERRCRSRSATRRRRASRAAP